MPFPFIIKAGREIGKGKRVQGSGFRARVELEIRNTKWRWRLRRNFDSASRRRHFERSREIYIAERSLPDVRQHQDIVFPWRIHADFLQCSKDPSATLGMTMLENPSHQALVPRQRPTNFPPKEKARRMSHIQQA